MTDIPGALRAHLEDLQGTAYVAESLIDAIVSCGDNPRRKALAMTLAESAQEVLAELGRGLDSVEIDRLVAP
jgi:hypothetical protein